MGLNWTQISMDDMTMLYLYGSFSVPGDLTNDAIIRPKNEPVSITIDAVSYMASGPGRFARGSISPLVDEFMSDRSRASNQELLENVPHTINALGQRVFNRLGSR